MVSCLCVEVDSNVLSHVANMVKVGTLLQVVAVFDVVRTMELRVRPTFFLDPFGVARSVVVRVERAVAPFCLHRIDAHFFISV